MSAALESHWTFYSFHQVNITITFAHIGRARKTWLLSSSILYIFPEGSYKVSQHPTS